MALRLRRELHGLCAAKLHGDCPSRWVDSDGPGHPTAACRCVCDCHGTVSLESRGKLAKLLKAGADEHAAEMAPQ